MNANAKLTYCVDLAKNKFQVHTFSARGEVLQRRTLTRAKFDELFSDPKTPGEERGHPESNLPVRHLRRQPA